MQLDTRNLDTVEIERLATMIEKSQMGLLWSAEHLKTRGKHEEAIGWLALNSEAERLAEDLRAVIKARNEALNALRLNHASSGDVSQVYLTETRRGG
jgi:hypothetical protein